MPGFFFKNTSNRYTDDIAQRGKVEHSPPYLQVSMRPIPSPATRRLACFLGVIAFIALATPAAAQEKYKETRSGAQYVHYIQLYDAAGVMIDPASPTARPYSPMQTCKKCHDYKAISHGFHFNAAEKLAKDGNDRAGEPWIFTDPRSGTQLPLSLRERAGPGLFKAKDAGLTRFKFLTEFGRHLPGGGIGESDHAKPQASGESEEPDAKRFKISGGLEIDCMICHSNSREYSHERWIKQIAEQNFAWAPTYALGIGKVKGSAKSVPDDFDPAKPPAEGSAAAKLPETHYDVTRFDEEKNIFFDIIRKPTNNACNQCHTARPVGDHITPKWTHDEDVHVKAGIGCVDCHRNDIGHHAVRGFLGEKHPTGQSVSTLSCRGCHLDAGEAAADHNELGGRLGAPKPLHKGIPPVHFEKMSCTSCHSGPLPGDKPGAVQTSMAHVFGLPTQTREDSDLPAIVQPVFLKVPSLDGSPDKLTPHRVVWPAYWAWMEAAGTPGSKLTPMDPTEVYSKTLRRVLRIRSDFRAEAAKVTLTDDEKKKLLGDAAGKPDAELTAEQQTKLADLTKQKAAEAFNGNLVKVLTELAKTAPNEKSQPVYVANGKVFSLDTRGGGTIVSVEHAGAEPYKWPLAHNVRPARQSLGVIGCTECHAKGSPIFYSTVTPVGPAADAAPISKATHELNKEDAKLLAAWEQSFGGRPMFKWLGFVSIGAVALIVLLFALLGLNGLLKMLTRRG